MLDNMCEHVHIPYYEVNAVCQSGLNEKQQTKKTTHKLEPKRKSDEK